MRKVLRTQLMLKFSVCEKLKVKGNISLICFFFQKPVSGDSSKKTKNKNKHNSNALLVLYTL